MSQFLAVWLAQSSTQEIAAEIRREASGWAASESQPDAAALQPRTPGSHVVMIVQTEV